MRFQIRCILCLFVSTTMPLFAQQPQQIAPQAAQPAAAASAPAEKPGVPPLQETIVVLGSAEPVSLGESSRSVVAVDMQDNPLAYPELEDYLRTDSSVDIQQRGPGNVQSDISVRGASFEQTLVLLDGFRINDVQTSHFNLDVPVPQPMLGGVNILHGAGSTLYGSDALGGVVDFLTIKPVANTLLLRTGGGSFGETEQLFLGSVIGTVAGHAASEVLSGERYFSDGFTYDRDYRVEAASSESRFNTGLGDTDLLLATSDRDYGANGFYGDYPASERTKQWFAGLRQPLGAGTEAAVGYRRHTDEFILFRDQPSIYENNHIDQSWQAVVRREQTIFKTSSVFYGVEEDTEGIHSNNLGIHGRNRGAGYLDVDLRSEKYGTLSGGVREEILDGGRSVFSPMLAGSYLLRPTVKLRASAGNGFRLPTFTDLYYSDPVHIPNPNLKPESAWNFDGGVDWFPTPRAVLSATGFYSRQHDTIDYVRANSSLPYQAENLTHVRFAGAEASALWHFTANQQVKLAWTLLQGAQSALDGLQSLYIFNYPANNANAEWQGTFDHGAFTGITLRTRVGVVQRYQQQAYPVWDGYISRTAGRVRPYLQMTNLSNTGYQEIAGVAMPGRAFVGGVEIFLSKPNP